MKRLFRRLFEWLGWVKKEQPSEAIEPQVDWNEVDEAPIFQETHYGEVNAEPVEEEVDKWAEEEPTDEEELQDLVDFKENHVDKKPPLPKDANDIQRLTKYNNPNTVYRDSKGRFASLN